MNQQVTRERHPPFIKKVRGVLNADGHTYDHNCPQCVSAPDRYHCQFSGDPYLHDECEQCSNGSWSGHELYSCDICESIYCDECRDHHIIPETGVPKG